MKDLMKLDLYELLNVKITASESEIKKAYRKKALILHPDKNPKDPKADENFKQLTKVVEILTNHLTRADYDKLFRARKERIRQATLNRQKEKEARKAAKEAAREKEESKKKKQHKEKEEEKRKCCSHKADTKRTVPTWPPSASKSKLIDGMNFKIYMKSRNKEKMAKNKTTPTWPPSPNSHSEIDSELIDKMNSRKCCSHKADTKRTIPTWPPSASKSKLIDGMSFKSYMKNRDKEKTSKNRTTPTWPPTSPNSHSEIDSELIEKMNSRFSFNFTPIVRSATFVAPSCSEFINLQKGSAPIIKPAKFVAPTNSKNSDGFQSTQKERSSFILKPATFVAPTQS